MFNTAYEDHNNNQIFLDKSSIDPSQFKEQDKLFSADMKMWIVLEDCAQDLQKLQCYKCSRSVELELDAWNKSLSAQ